MSMAPEAQAAASDASPRARGAVDEAARILSAGCPPAWPELVLILGSGLGDVVDGMEVEQSWDYRDLPGFPRASVSGHAGTLVRGRLHGVPLCVLHGREHFYERGRADAMAVPIRALRQLGAARLLMTNAVGSVNPAVPPGGLVLISDHINMSGTNPLIGLGTSAGDARFVDMSNAYDRDWAQALHAAAAAAGVTLADGVYACFPGPSFETPAEVRAAKALGADTVGMSVVFETILARQCGLRVAAISVVTNLAAGIGDEALGHRATMQAAAMAAPRCAQLLHAWLARHAER